MKDDAKELMKREWHAGTRVTNCVVHMGQPIDKRPDDCHLCLTDLRNRLNYCVSVNEWLNEWKKDAEHVLQQYIVT